MLMLFIRQGCHEWVGVYVVTTMKNVFFYGDYSLTDLTVYFRDIRDCCYCYGYYYYTILWLNRESIVKCRFHTMTTFVEHIERRTIIVFTNCVRVFFCFV